MSHAPSRVPRSAVSLAVALSVACLAACKEAPSSKGGAAAGTSRDSLVEGAISRGAVSPQFGQPLSAEMARVGASSSFQKPRSVAVDKAGNVYVADTGNFRVVKLDSSGKEVLTFGKQGTGPGQFTEPWKVAIASDGNILVLDRAPAWVHVYTAGGQFKMSLAGPKMQLYAPGGMAVAPDGTIVIANTGVSNLLLLRPDGQRLGDLVATIAGERLDQPTDAAFDSQGGLHVYQTAEKKSPSLLLHRPAGGGQDSKWIAVESPSTPDSARLVVGPDGRIYMTDPGNRRLLVYSSDGKTCNPVKPEGPEAAPFARLTGIALDSKGSLYAVDGDAGAVFRLKLRAP